MLNDHALVVSGYDRYSLDNTVEYGLDLRSRRNRYSDTVVEREFDVLVDGMVTLSVLVHHRSVNRPRQFALVLCELGIEGLVDNRLFG